MSARTVTLSWREVRTVAYAGTEREIVDRYQCKRHRWGADPATGWTNHALGALGEYVVARLFGLPWSIGDQDPRGDVGALQVRTTDLERGCLIVHDEDDDAAPFVLVCGPLVDAPGSAPRFTVPGWIYGAAAKLDAYRRAPNGRPPAYFVPQSELVDLDRLDVLEVR